MGSSEDGLSRCDDPWLCLPLVSGSLAESAGTLHFMY